MFKKITIILILLSLFSLGPFLLAKKKAALHKPLVSPDMYKNLLFRHIGPAGNRTSAVIGVPGDPMVYYIGASSGGIWKSADGGDNWQPIFDKQPAQSIGALAVCSSDPNVLWAGTGEAFIRSNVSIGNGVYCSTDAGKSWKQMGLTNTGRIGRIVIHPQNPNIVLVAALGHCYGPQKERGVYKTIDGGKNWQQVLFTDQNTGCFEIAMDPNNPRILFAGMWPLVIHTWGRESGGPNGGIWKSTDLGDTWTQLKGNGLPKPPLGKIGLAIAPSNSKVVYALIETGSPNRGVLWRSSDGGDSWRISSYNRLLNERPHYASRIMVNPADENEVYFAANSQSRTLDGGYTSETVPWSGDCHDMWVDPKIPDRMMISDDGGVIISKNRGKTWRRINLPIAQMYHVAVDNQIPYYVYGGRQDGSAFRGPMTGQRISDWNGNGYRWQATAGGECGFIVPDPVDANIVWGGSYNADLQVADYKTGHINTVKVWPESLYGSHAAAVKYRFNWTFPIHISPHDHNKVYVGSQFVHATTDRGRSWKKISPDLTTNDKSKQGPSGGLTRDNLAVEYGCTLFAIAESPLEKGVVWAGSNDGLLHITRDGGKSWQNVGKNIIKLPPWGTISNIEPSRFEVGTAYVTIDFHQVNNRDPFVYKTEDYGKSWINIGKGIPQSMLSYTHWVAEDPVRQGMLFLGTENALYITLNDGKSWQLFQNNIPHAPVHHMVVQSHFNDLVVGTYGRGIWILDDITPLQQLKTEVISKEAYLFEPRPAYRFFRVAGGSFCRPQAFIHYWLKEKGQDKVCIKITDSKGNLVKELSGPAEAGINRLVWSIRHYAANPAKLRTPPPGNPHVVEEKRFLRRWEKEGWFPILSWGSSAGFRGFLAAPGNYTITFKYGKIIQDQTLVVKKDPRSAGNLAGIYAQEALQKSIRTELNRVSSMVNRIEWVKRQLFEMSQMIKQTKGSKKVLKEIRDFNLKLQSLEDELFQPILAEGDSKSFRNPQKLYCKLSVLSGDVGDSLDFAPNKQQMEVFELLRKGVQKQASSFEKLMKSDLEELNTFLMKEGLTGIIAPKQNK
jgi:photosystem II stability/assembly factor-like uncharacterized protein